MKGVDGVDASTPYGASARGLSGPRTLSLMTSLYISIRPPHTRGRVWTRPHAHTLPIEATDISGLCAGCLTNPGTPHATHNLDF